MSPPTPAELKRLYDIIETSAPKASEGSTAEEETPGIVTIRNKNGTPIMFMPTDVYLDIKKSQP